MEIDELSTPCRFQLCSNLLFTAYQGGEGIMKPTPPFPFSSSPGPVVQKENLLTLLARLLVRVYTNVSDSRKTFNGKVTEEVRAKVLRLWQEGKRVCQIGREVGLPHKSVSRILGNLKGQ